MKYCFIVFVLFQLLIVKNYAQTIVKDADGNVYDTIKLGKQVWMQENLRTTRYQDGSKIKNVTDKSKWFNLSSGAYCNYNNKEKNSKLYGRLYNWYAASSASRICPFGYRLPAEKDWNILEDYLDEYTDTTAIGKFGVDIGTKLKGVNTADTSKAAVDTMPNYTFKALPAGFRSLKGSFVNLGLVGVWWTNTPFNDANVWYRFITYKDAQANRNYVSKKCGLSVRCIKN